MTTSPSMTNVNTERPKSHFGLIVATSKNGIRQQIMYKITMLLFLCCLQVAHASQVQPNIILIYADDLGIGLLGHQGQKII
jgi:hypothetical protein